MESSLVPQPYSVLRSIIHSFLSIEPITSFLEVEIPKLNIILTGIYKNLNNISSNLSFYLSLLLLPSSHAMLQQNWIFLVLLFFFNNTPKFSTSESLLLLVEATCASWNSVCSQRLTLNITLLCSLFLNLQLEMISPCFKTLSRCILPFLKYVILSYLFSFYKELIILFPSIGRL